MAEFNNVTTLYVDDEDVNLFLFNANFKNKFNVTTAQSPVKALDIIDEKHDEIIIVISDMHMPVMNGVEFIKKAHQKHSNIYYYILSGFDHNPEIEQALEQKLISKFLTKPFDVDEITDIVKNVANSTN